jgi:flagellar M-ring protein FliF
MAEPQNPPATSLAARLRNLPGAGRLGAMVAAAAGVAVFVGAVLWSQSSDYKVLFSNVADRDGGAIIQALGQMNVPYRLSAGGSAILVPSDQVHEVRLRLASQGLPRGGTVGFELIENQRFGATQFQEQVNYQRALEGELARSIQSLAAVQSARVHLAIPKPTVFLRDAQKPSASVLVNLYAGRTLERAQVAGIVHLVSSSVPDLPLKAVSVVDQNGNLLSGEVAGKPGAGLDATQLAYLTQIEASYTRRVVEILEPIVGRANVRAQVTADVDFSESEATAETYKPNQAKDSASIRSQQTHESSTAGAGAASGVPGALTNQPAPAATAPIGAPAAAAAAPAGAPGATSTRRESTINYELDKTVRHTRTPTGSVKRLSAAVVVNYRRVATTPAATDAKGGKAAAENAKPVLQPLSAEEMASINALVKEAMGFNAARGDSLNVVNVAFSGEEPTPAPELPIWKDPETVQMARDVGKPLALLALGVVLFFTVLRPALRSLAATGRAANGAPEGELLPGPRNSGTTLDASLNATRQIARQDPRVVAGVVRHWVSGNG